MVVIFIKKIDNLFDCNIIYIIFADTMKKIIFTATALILSLYINAQDLQIPTDSATRSSEKEAFSLFKEKNYAQALIRYESAANMRQKMNIEKDSLFEKDLLFQGKCYFRLRRIDEAVDRAQKLVNHYTTNFNKSDSVYTIYLDNLALYQASAGNFVDAEKNSREALVIYEKLMRNDFDLAIILEHLAESCDKNSKYTEAIKHEMRALNILKTIYGEHSNDYLNEIVYLKKYYENNNNADKAQKLQETIDKLTEESKDSKIMIPEMFATPERCHLYNKSILAGAKQYLDCDLKKTNVLEISQAIISWSKTSEEIIVDFDSIIKPILENQDNLFLIVAIVGAMTEYALEHQIKEIDASGLKQVKPRVEAFYRRNKATLGKCRELEQWFKE